jgi:hypothetical protein
LTAKDAEYLKKVKYGVRSLEEAESLAKEYTDKVCELKDKLISENDYTTDEEVIKVYDAVKTDILRQWFREELTK